MFIFSNLAVSLDGKISTRKRGLHYLGTAYDRKHMQKLRLRADAILMGASTLKSFKEPCRVSASKKQPINVILSSQLHGVSASWPFFKDLKTQRILFVSHTADLNTLKKFELSSEIIQLKRPSRKNSIPSQIIQELSKKKVSSLLIEGGGGVMWTFVEQNEINEYHLTLTPHLIGGKEAPSLVEGAGLLPQNVLNLRLHSHQVVQNEIYLIYKRTLKRGL